MKATLLHKEEEIFHLLETRDGPDLKEDYAKTMLNDGSWTPPCTPIANRRKNALRSPDFAIIDNEQKSEKELWKI